MLTSAKVAHKPHSLIGLNPERFMQLSRVWGVPMKPI